MAIHHRQNDASGKGDAHAGKQGKEGKNDTVCRCKEVSKKSFPEMIRLMISDLAFWRKTKGRE